MLTAVCTDLILLKYWKQRRVRHITIFLMTIFPEYCGPNQSNKRICGHIKKSHFKNNSMDALWIWHIYCVTWLCNHLRNWNYSPDDKHLENLGLMAITFAVPVCIKNSVWAWFETYYFSGCGGRDKSGKSIRIQVPSEGKQYHREATLLTQTRSSLPSSGETVSAAAKIYNNIQRLKRMTRTGSENCSPLLLQMETSCFLFTGWQKVLKATPAKSAETMRKERKVSSWRWTDAEVSFLAAGDSLSQLGKTFSSSSLTSQTVRSHPKEPQGRDPVMRARGMSPKYSKIQLGQTGILFGFSCSYNGKSGSVFCSVSLCKCLNHTSENVFTTATQCFCLLFFLLLQR